MNLGLTARYPRVSWFPSAAFAVLGLAFLSVLVGLLLAVGGLYAAALVLSGVTLLAGLVMPIRLLVLSMLVAVYLLVGQLQYFLRIDKAFWIPYLLGLFLFIRLLALRIKGRVKSRDNDDGYGRAILWSFGLFLITAVAASFIRGIEPLQWFVAGKEYFFLWSMLLAMLLGAFAATDVEKLIRVIPWFLLPQVPAVLYQRFVVVPKRLGGSAFDAVVGLFGGDPNGGGASGAMAMFSLIAMAFMLYGVKSGQVSKKRAFAVALLAIVPVVLAEVKFVLILLPLAFLVIYGSDLMRRPLAAIGGIAVAVIGTAGLLGMYQLQFTSDKTKEGKTVAGYIDTMIARNTDTRLVNLQTGEMGRVGAILHWRDNQHAYDVASALIGNGIGATRVGGLVVGDVVKKFRLRVGRSSLVVFLWEVGLLGTLAVVSGLVVTSIAAFRLANDRQLAERAWVLRGCGLGLFLILLGFPYNTDFVEVAQTQILALLLVGYVLVSGRSRAKPKLNLSGLASIK